MFATGEHAVMNGESGCRALRSSTMRSKSVTRCGSGSVMSDVVPSAFFVCTAVCCVLIMLIHA